MQPALVIGRFVLVRQMEKGRDRRAGAGRLTWTLLPSSRSVSPLDVSCRHQLDDQKPNSERNHQKPNSNRSLRLRRAAYPVAEKGGTVALGRRLDAHVLPHRRRRRPSVRAPKRAQSRLTRWPDAAARRRTKRSEVR
jgi:hypothetical protein